MHHALGLERVDPGREHELVGAAEELPICVAENPASNGPYTRLPSLAVPEVPLEGVILSPRAV